MVNRSLDILLGVGRYFSLVILLSSHSLPSWRFLLFEAQSCSLYTKVFYCWSKWKFKVSKKCKANLCLRGFARCPSFVRWQLSSPSKTLPVHFPIKLSSLYISFGCPRWISDVHATHYCWSGQKCLACMAPVRVMSHGHSSRCNTIFKEQ